MLGFFTWLEKVTTPHVNVLGRELSNQFGLIQGKTTAYNQSADNCSDIASVVAQRFGYERLDKSRMLALVDRWENWNVWGRKSGQSNPLDSLGRSDAYYVIYKPEYMSLGGCMYHVSFEYRGKEYNYGPATDQKHSVLFKIPAKQSVDKVQQSQ